MNKLVCVMLLFLFTAADTMVYSMDTVSVHTDFIYINGKQIGQDVFYTLPAAGKMSVKLECYRYVPGRDSVLLARTIMPAKALKKGTGKIRVLYNGSAYKGYLQPVFAEVLNRTGIAPPGNYKVFLTLTGDSSRTSRMFLREIDSTLAMQSPLRRDIHRVLLEGVDKKATGKNQQAAATFRRSDKRMKRYFRQKGIMPRSYQREGKEVTELYYGSWFLGRYEMDSNAPVNETIRREQNSLASGTGSLTGNELGNYQSLFSQFRELKKGRKDNSQMEGMISWSSILGNDQEEFSQADNNYHELRGSIELPVFDLPVTFEGLYTTQDRGRQTKAGYVRMHYDAARSKEKLMQLIGDYNQRYAHTDARGAGYQMIYGQFIHQAGEEKTKAIAKLKREAGLTEFDPAGFDPAILKAKAEEQALRESRQLGDSVSGSGNTAGPGDLKDNTEKAKRTKEEAEARYRNLQAQYDQIMGLEQQITRYQTLLDQYRHTRHYDSLLAHDKLKDLEHPENLSYKDLSKKADRILPEGKAKGFLTGITSFDAGMFPKYVSGYTLSGQRMTGVDFGYDVGVAEVGVGYGKTEYANRDGSVEGYRSYSGRVMFKPVFKQKFGLVYYGYSPGHKLLKEDGFFKGVDVSLPSFRKPVHIFSGLYSSELSRYATLSGEYAVSRRQGETLSEGVQSRGMDDQSAYNIQVAGFIPHTSINLEAGYEHTGQGFENSTLPVVMAGTDRYRAAGRGDFFRSFLTLGIEYNYMQQKSFHYRGGNSRWGFDIQTHSRRYPSLSLSYKPFSTFRAYDDTMSIAQKPLLGAVWTGRINYQVKRPDHAIRFVLLYNRNNSITDTVRYGSDLVQLTTIFTQGRQNISLNLGSSRIHTNLVTEAYPAFNNSRFANLSAGRELGAGTNVSAGADIAYSRIGLSRYGLLAALGYRIPKRQVMVRLNVRYTNYRLDEVIAWKQLYAGGLELIWQFRRSMKGA